MPLDNVSPEESVGKNIKTEMRAGRPQKQAVAIGLSVQRRAQGEPSRFKKAGMGRVKALESRMKGGM